jgi:hypothetical protein
MFFTRNRERLLSLVAERRLPAIYASGPTARPAA